MGFAFTPAQARAIGEKGGAILVSAAAGSGKTRVLTERLVRRVTQGENPPDIDRFLVITYTRAAAAELRSRIMEELSRLAAERPGERRLRRQQNLCCRAHIGTIHSFCTEVIRENCHLLGLPPTFTVLEEERGAELRDAVLTRLLEEKYEKLEDDPVFLQLADSVGAGRDDSRLEQALRDIHGKLRSQPWPREWAEAQKAALRGRPGDAGETLWGRELLEETVREAERWTAAMEDAIREISAAGGAVSRAYLEGFSETAEGLRAFCAGLGQGWDAARAAADIPFPRLKPLKDAEGGELKRRLTALRDACKKAAERYRNLFSWDSAALLADLHTVAPATEALLELALELDRRFTAEKRRRGVLDFSDLEHAAAWLLLEGEKHRPGPLAEAWSRRFEEIMVDEYQDVSPIQDLIFRAVSRREQNLFLVGDVKQSIYRFRLADPTLFLEKYRAYSPSENPVPGEPRRILLQENFRSRESVLAAANLVFSSVMSRELGELDYDADAALKFGAASYPAGTDTPAELVYVDEEGRPGGEETEIPPEKSEAEARYVARRILALMEAKTPVYTGEAEPRPCRWEDFAVLLRSPGSRGSIFRRVLSASGIPVENGQGTGFFTSLEVTVAVDLLAVIDNPHADIPLISVLRSPAFAFDGNALAAIRVKAPGADFYTALRTAAGEGDPRCAAVLEKLDRWRVLAPDLPPEELLWQVCADTGLFALCAAMEDGENRRRNLTRLLEYARAFASGGRRGLFRFVRWLQAMAERGAEPEPGTGAGAVRLLSIHRSKGLEFPFVFLCDLSHRFNLTDAADPVLLHSALGLGPKYTDRDRGEEHPTLPRLAIERRLAAETLSEEMRVLYVAMTRAREKLIMTAGVKKPEEYLEKLAGTPLPLSPVTLRGAASPDRWVALAALGSPGPITVSVAERSEEETAAAPEAEADWDAPNSALDRLLEERLNYVYPFAGSVDLPSKLTATELKRVFEDRDPEAVSLAADAEATPGRACTSSSPAPETVGTAGETGQSDPSGFHFSLPALGVPRDLSPAEAGTAAHTFLQYLDFGKTAARSQLEEEAERLAAGGFLTEAERQSLNLESFLRLFASPLGRELREAKELRREFRFTLRSPAADYYPEAAAGDTLLLQGVVDCFFFTPEGITLVDYKTDRLRRTDVPVRAERYRPQLAAYAGALERIFGRPVRRRVLWFLVPGVEAELT